MVYLPPTILGQFVLGTIILLYILLLILNLVSFGGIAWITFVDYNIQFGLWRVCYGAASSSRTCYQWSSSQAIIDTATNTIIFSGKPGFVKAAQGLEIISLIFYVFAGILIIIGIIDLDIARLEYMFGAAAILLFLCIVFLSASLGVMSVQGRSNHNGAYLAWAWWIGLIGLTVTIICVVVLIGFIIDVALSTNANNFDQFYREQQQPWNFFPMATYPFNNEWSLQYPYPQYSYPQYQYPQYQQNISPILETMIRERFGYAHNISYQTPFGACLADYAQEIYSVHSNATIFNNNFECIRRYLAEFIVRQYFNTSGRNYTTKAESE